VCTDTPLLRQFRLKETLVMMMMMMIIIIFKCVPNFSLWERKHSKMKVGDECCWARMLTHSIKWRTTL